MRIQTAQLLYQFVRELPDRKLELSTVMEILTFQAGDEQAPVRNWVKTFILIMKSFILKNPVCFYTQGLEVCPSDW
jgi:hypothetical protein